MRNVGWRFLLRALAHAISVLKVMWKFIVSHSSQFVIMASSFLEPSSNRIACVSIKYIKITHIKVNVFFYLRKNFTLRTDSEYRVSYHKESPTRIKSL